MAGDRSRLPDNSFPASLRADVLEKYCEGISATALGREHHISVRTITNWARVAGVYRTYHEARNLWTDQNDPPITDEVLADILASYADGEPWYKITKRHGWKGHSSARLKRALEPFGVEFRGRATAVRMATQNQDLASMSRDAWWSLYWSPQSRYPTVEALAEQFGVMRHTVSRYLRKAGLTVRTGGQQHAIEFRMGRFQPHNPNGYGYNIRFAWEKNRGRKQPRALVLRLAALRRRPVTRPCSWCARPITRVRSRMKDEFVCCGSSCAGSLSAWRRRNPDAPRPLIAHALRGLLGSQRPNEDRLQRLAESVGAGETEIIEALLDL